MQYIYLSKGGKNLYIDNLLTQILIHFLPAASMRLIIP